VDRIKSVDVFRVLAIIGVISAHTTPFKFYGATEEDLSKYIDIFLNQFVRFTVPFFFALAGYFWGVRIRKKNAEPFGSAHTMGKRVFFLYIAWCLIYLLPIDPYLLGRDGIFGSVKFSLEMLQRYPVDFLLQGTKVHLWFLMAMVFAVYIAGIFIQKGWEKQLLWFGAALYIFGVLGKAYMNTPIGFEAPFDTRNGPFFSTIFFACGYVLSGYEPKTDWLKYGFAIFVAGFIMHFSEMFLLWKFFNASPRHDYLFGTFLMGMGMTLMALSNHKWFQSESLATIGMMTLGIYAIHFAFVDFFNVYDLRYNSPAWEIGLVFIVFGLSVISTYIMSKTPGLKKLVM